MEKKENKSINFERKTGEIDIIVDENDILFSSVSPEIVELILQLDENNKRFSKNNDEN